ncbi:MAG: sulfite exporter TauE/SafE family protein [Xanthomonadales bacterium]|nr:sulfite exporter TauE/SafE family protein [Xanthomonadales bacterium]
MTLITTMFAVFMVGLLGSAHCFGMCGGIAAAMGAGSIEPGASKWQAFRKALIFNLGRIGSYAMLGGIVGALMGSVGLIVEFKQWGISLRLLTAMMIFLIGLQYLTNKSYLGWLERGGGRLWQKMGRIMGVTANSNQAKNPNWKALRTGLIWGWLPCGLVYTVLLTAAASGSALPAALIMLAFGIGTLPALTSITVAGPLLSQLRSSLQARRAIGLAMMLFAIWIGGWALLMHTAGGHAGHNPETTSQHSSMQH